MKARCNFSVKLISNVSGIFKGFYPIDEFPVYKFTRIFQFAGKLLIRFRILISRIFK